LKTKTLNKNRIMLENENLNEAEIPQLNIGAVSGSLPSDEEIRDGADEWVFDINGIKWSNNDDTAGDNYGSFIAGAKWVLSRLSNDR
jgi:hypothetical protein